MPPLPIDVQQAPPILPRPRGRGRAGRGQNVMIPLGKLLVDMIFVK